MFRKSGAQLFHGLIGLVLQSIVGKHDTAIRRNILQKRNQPFPLVLSQLENIEIAYLKHRSLRQHGHGLRHFGKGLHRQLLSLQPVVVEFLKALGNQLFA